MSDETDRDTSFTDVDWGSVNGSPFAGLRPSVATAVTEALLSLLVVGFVFDRFVTPPGAPTLPFWDVTRVDWLTLAASAPVVGYGVVPAARNPDRVVTFLRRYPSRPLPVLGLGYVLVLFSVGLFGPVVLQPPELNLSLARQPPAFLSVHTSHVVECVGPVRGDYCHGTLRTPLGTTRAGESILVWTVYGARTALQFGLVSVAIMLPLATAVGALSAYYRGWIEAVLMRLADVQQAVPTFLVYFVMVVFVEPSLFVLIVAYGLFNWGGMAQVVYSTTLSEAQEHYVRVAESSGAGGLYTIRRHLLPNVSGTVLVEVTLLIPRLILLEVLFSFVGLGGDQSFSWGQLVQRGLRFDPSQVSGGFAVSLRGIGIGDLGGLWWITFVPIGAVVLTVFLSSVFGDAVQTTVESESR